LDVGCDSLLERLGIVRGEKWNDVAADVDEEPD
jgi:hypothetical protein